MAMIDSAREDFALDPAMAHLNHGSFGSVPKLVRAERMRLLDEYDANPMRLVAGDLLDRIAVQRSAAARFLGADPDLCAFVNNATYGVTIALNSIELEAGDEIIITDHSYHAVTLTVQEIARRCGATVVVAPIDLGSDQTVEVITGFVNERTRMVIIDDISSATAQRHPIAELSHRLKALGVPILVDAAHTPGMIPAPLAGIDPDFWVGNLHKWAFAPGGTALLRVNRARRERTVPLVVSYGQPHGFPLHLEQQGTRDFTTWLTVKSGLSVFDHYGQSAIQQHNAELAAYGQTVVGEALGLDPAELPDPGEGVSMRILPLPEGIATRYEAAMALRSRIAAELATEVAVNVWRGRGWLRVSAQIYNSREEYERLAAGLPAVLA